MDELELLPDEDFLEAEALPGALPPGAIRTRAEYGELVRHLAEHPDEVTPEQRARLGDYLRRRQPAGPHVPPKRLACIAFTAQGERLAERVATAFVQAPGDASLSRQSERWVASVARGSGPNKTDLSWWTCENFAHADALLFVGATGIAVRAIAPHVRSKTSDPAVLVMDADGTWVIPLLSGHIGGANRLALRIAELAEAQAVLTTATDVRGLWAVDEWATRCGLIIDNPGAIKTVSAKLLAGDTVRVCTSLSCADESPAQVELVGVPYDEVEGWSADVIISALALSAGPGAGEGSQGVTRTAGLPMRGEARLSLPDASAVGLSARDEVMPAAAGADEAGLPTQSEARPSASEYEVDPPGVAGPLPSGGGSSPLRLIPRIVRVGIGCRRGVSRQQVEAAWQAALAELATQKGAPLDERAICGVYSIDLKARESGLLAFCAAHDWPLTTYSAQELADVDGIFSSSSSFVREVTGVDNVCERAAQHGGAWPLLFKQVHDGVTISLAREDVSLSFGEPSAGCAH